MKRQEQEKEMNSEKFGNEINSRFASYCTEGHFEQAIELLPKVTDIDFRNEEWDVTPVINAAYRKAYKAVETFIKYKADVNIFAGYGGGGYGGTFCLLNTLADNPFNEQVEKLIILILENGGNANLIGKGWKGKSIWEVLEDTNRLEFKACLVKHNTNMIDLPFLKHCKNGEFLEAGKLLDRVFDKDITMDSGYTPLMHAIMHQNYDLATAIVQKGADVNKLAGSAYTEFRKCALMLLSSNVLYNGLNEKAEKFIEFILKKGANLNLQVGNTILIEVLKSCSSVEFLEHLNKHQNPIKDSSVIQKAALNAVYEDFIIPFNGDSPEHPDDFQ